MEALGGIGALGGVREWLRPYGVGGEARGGPRLVIYKNKIIKKRGGQEPGTLRCCVKLRKKKKD